MASSFIQPGTIKAIAETVDVTGLSDEAAKALAPDVEYRLREVIQASLAAAAWFSAWCSPSFVSYEPSGG